MRAARGPVGPPAGEGPRATRAEAGRGPGSAAPESRDAKASSGVPRRRRGAGSARAAVARGARQGVSRIPGPRPSRRSARGVRGGGGARPAMSSPPPARKGFYRQEVTKTAWEVRAVYQDLQPVGSGAYGAVW